LFKEENIYYVNLGKTLDRLGIKYLVLRKDESIFDGILYEDKLETQKSMEIVLDNAILAIYKNKEFTGITKIYDEKLVSNYGLDTHKKLPELGILQKLDTGDTSPTTLIEDEEMFEIISYDDTRSFIEYTDKPSDIDLPKTQLLLKDNRKIDLALNDYKDRFIYPAKYTTKKDDGNPGYWKLGSLENLTHAEVDLFFRNLGLSISQFDYEQGVAIARDGWQKLNKMQKGKPVYINFSKHPNVTHESSTIKYSTKGEDFKHAWNIVRSDPFSTEGISALEVNLMANINPDLIPHFKIYSYDKDNNILDIRFIYPGLDNKAQAIVKLPQEAHHSDFSIWTLPSFGGYSYEVRALEIDDISSNVKPVQMSFTHPTNCKENCEVFARMLKSYIGGTVELEVNNQYVNAQTKIPLEQEKEEYMWFHMGNLERVADNPTFTLNNFDGFNSINALVLLTQDEYNSVIDTASKLPKEALSLYDTQAMRPKTKVTRLNPTKYEIEITGATDEPGVIAFSRPYDANWKLNGKSAKLVNGYINGWKLGEMKDGKYVVEYAPQQQFYIGARISLITGGLILLYLVATKVVIVSVAKSTSQG
jgi:hypothetical protein